MKRKSIPAGRVTIKNADEGIVEAVFATLGVIDKDGDVITKGAIPNGAKVTISAYGHKSWEGALPVGLGTISEVGDEAIVSARFFMDTDAGRDTFTTVKNLAAEGLGEWSFSLRNVEAERGELDGVKANIITAVEVHEVSPVLLGAGVDTRTLVTKGAKQLDSSLRRLLSVAGRNRFESGGRWCYLSDYDADEGFAVYEVESADDGWQLIRVSFTRSATAVTLGEDEVEVHPTTVFLTKGAKFSEHADAVLTDVDALIARAEEVVTLRAAKGKTIGDESAALLTKVSDGLARLKTLLEEPPVAESDDPPHSSDDDAAIEAFLSEAVRFDIEISQGVTS